MFCKLINLDKNKSPSVFFASDYQFYKSLTPKLFADSMITSCEPILEYLANRVKKDYRKIETAVFGGDYTQNDGQRDKNDSCDRKIYGENLGYHYGNDPTDSIDKIKHILSNHYDKLNYVFVQGNHDPNIGAIGSSKLDKSGPYEFKDYIIYVLNDEDYVGLRPRVSYNKELPYIVPSAIKKCTNPNETVKKCASKLSEYLKKLTSFKDTRPVFICAHQPLHYSKLNYNGNAHYIFDAVNESAKILDIIFLFGHTHSESDEIGGALSYVPVYGKLKVCDDSSGILQYKNAMINFTYMNYGFLGAYSGICNCLSASVIEITKDKLIIYRYPVNQPTVEIHIQRKT